MSRPLHVVVMGVAGCGKTAVAERLRDHLGLAFAEGDDFHPEANVAKMRSGQPLTDEDRWPWLEALADWTQQLDDEGRSTVLTCSALKRAYRDVLRRPDPAIFFVHLHGELDLLRQRMERRDHFMPLSLLQSQFDTLEPLQADEPGVAIDVSASLDEVVARAESSLRSRLD